MPDELRTETGSKKKSPHGERSLVEALNRSSKVKNPITSEHYQLIVRTQDHRFTRFDCA